jgi:hypothetical protein
MAGYRVNNESIKWKTMQCLESWEITSRYPTISSLDHSFCAGEFGRCFTLINTQNEAQCGNIMAASLLLLGEINDIYRNPRNCYSFWYSLINLMLIYMYYQLSYTLFISRFCLDFVFFWSIPFLSRLLRQNIHYMNVHLWKIRPCTFLYKNHT